MKIAVIIASRGRPRQLTALLTSMKLAQSEQAGVEVEYVIACDEDDPATKQVCEAIINDPSIGWKIPLRYSCAPRSTSIGRMLNETAELVPADVYTSPADDLICATFGWDLIIAQAWEKCKFGVFWWLGECPLDSGQAALYPIVTDQWRKAAGGLYTNDYPFWWDDVCLTELWNFATCKDNIPLPIKLIDKPHKTTRMRDLWFWREYYRFTLPMRIRQAYDIAGKLGLPEPIDTTERVKNLQIALDEGKKSFFDDLEKTQGDSNPPDQRYLEVKRRAEAIMNALHVPNFNPPAPEQAAPVLDKEALLSTLKKDPAVQDLLAKLTAAQLAAPVHAPDAALPARKASSARPRTDGGKRSRPPSGKPSPPKPQRPS